MRVFFDTSVMVAALFEGHAFHRQAFPWLKRAREREFSFLVATHTLAELYSALTNLPVKPKITPGAAQELIHENVETVAEMVSLGLPIIRWRFSELRSLDCRAALSMMPSWREPPRSRQRIGCSRSTSRTFGASGLLELRFFLFPISQL